LCGNHIEASIYSLDRSLLFLSCLGLHENPPELPQMRAKDWGPMPRWVTLVDFFLAARATRAIISGAHRRVATTYAQLIAAMAAANKL
ncbi:hypothetical protein KI387_022956, partial [Taxus chinensis]